MERERKSIDSMRILFRDVGLCSGEVSPQDVSRGCGSIYEFHVKVCLGVVLSTCAAQDPTDQSESPHGFVTPNLANVIAVCTLLGPNQQPKAVRISFDRDSASTKEWSQLSHVLGHS